MKQYMPIGIVSNFPSRDDENEYLDSLKGLKSTLANKQSFKINYSKRASNKLAKLVNSSVDFGYNTVWANPKLEKFDRINFEKIDFIEVERLLREERADPNLLVGKQSLLVNSVVYSAGHMIRLLASYGADLNLKSEVGKRPLSYAIDFHDNSVVRLLLELGVDVNGYDEGSWSIDDKSSASYFGRSINVDKATFLIQAVSNGNLLAFKALLDAGADLMEVDSKGFNIFNHLKDYKLLVSMYTRLHSQLGNATPNFYFKPFYNGDYRKPEVAKVLFDKLANALTLQK